MADDFPQPGAQRRLLFNSQGGIVLRTGVFRPAVKNEHALTVQPVGGPVRRHIGTVPPNRADFLAADRLPRILPVLNCVSIEQHLPVGGENLGGNGRGAPEDLHTHSAQDREGNYQYKAQSDP